MAGSLQWARKSQEKSAADSRISDSLRGFACYADDFGQIVPFPVVLFGSFRQD